jgi:hypothetical protein
VHQRQRLSTGVVPNVENHTYVRIPGRYGAASGDQLWHSTQSLLGTAPAARRQVMSSGFDQYQVLVSRFRAARPPVIMIRPASRVGTQATPR